MIIKQKRISNIEKYFPNVQEGQEFQLAVPFSSLTPRVLQRTGFPPDFSEGDAILPNSIGPVSRFNAEGKWDIKRNLPKERRYIQTRIWRWNQWAYGGGVEEQERTCDIFRECYQRELIFPPSEELMFTTNAQNAFIVSRKFIWKYSEHENIKHAVNLFLELFGECHIQDDNQKLLIPPKIKRVHWKLLPSGEHPWIGLKPYIEERISRLSPSIQTVIYERQQNILAYKPSVCVVGSGGFYDYVAYVFPDQEIVVLESIRRGNAIYVFDKNWEQFSQLTKAEVLSQNVHLERITHAKGWKKRLNTLLLKATARKRHSA